MLISSVSLSSGRNILSKGMSESKFASAEFFLFQGVMFLVGATLLFPLALAENLLKTSCETFIYALIYGALLISAQWNYTVALKKKNSSLKRADRLFGCATRRAHGRTGARSRKKRRAPVRARGARHRCDQIVESSSSPSPTRRYSPSPAGKKRLSPFSNGTRLSPACT